MQIDNGQNFSLPASVVLNGSGYGVIRVAPAGESWQVVFMTIQCDTNVNEASFRVYSPILGDPYIKDTSGMGSSGDTSDTVYFLNDGQALFLEWSGGDAGTTARANLTYFKTVPENRGFRAFH